MSVTFNSVTIPFAQSNVGDLPTRDKVVDLPGSSGVEVLPMGKTSREIVVTGVSTSGSPTRAAIEALQDDRRHTLVIEGESYANTRCIGCAWGQKLFTKPDGYRNRFTLRFRQEVPD